MKKRTCFRHLIFLVFVTVAIKGQADGSVIRSHLKQKKPNIEDEALTSSTEDHNLSNRHHRLGGNKNFAIYELDTFFVVVKRRRRNVEDATGHWRTKVKQQQALIDMKKRFSPKNVWHNADYNNCLSKEFEKMQKNPNQNIETAERNCEHLLSLSGHGRN